MWNTEIWYIYQINHQIFVLYLITESYLHQKQFLNKFILKLYSVFVKTVSNVSLLSTKKCERGDTFSQPSPYNRRVNRTIQHCLYIHVGYLYIFLTNLTTLLLNCHVPLIITTKHLSWFSSIVIDRGLTYPWAF